MLEHMTARERALTLQCPNCKRFVDFEGEDTYYIPTVYGHVVAACSEHCGDEAMRKQPDIYRSSEEED